MEDTGAGVGFTSNVGTQTVKPTMKSRITGAKNVMVRDLKMAEQRFFYAFKVLKNEAKPTLTALKDRTFRVGGHIYNFKDMSSAEKKAVKILVGMRIGEATLLSLLAIGGIAGIIALTNKKKPKQHRKPIKHTK